MIYLLTTRKKSYTVEPFLNEWAPETKSFVRTVSYEDLLNQKNSAPGVYIFTDIDAVSRPMFNFIGEVAEKISALLGEAFVLNHPFKVMKRRELLRHLYGMGLNSFSVYSLADDFDKIRYPAFIRKADSHTGPLTALTYNPDELRAAMKNLLASGKHADDLVVIEFCDTRGKDGYFRKYTAFVVNNNVIPRYITFSKNWVVKLYRADNTIHEGEDMEFVQSNPHRQELLELFKLAGIDYGRVDYGMKDGKIQVWEINVNPYILKKKSFYSDRHMQGQQEFARLIANMFGDLDKMNTGVLDMPVVQGVGSLKRKYYIEKLQCEIRETLVRAVPARIYGAYEYRRCQPRRLTSQKE